jgi:hypothetical protein
VVVLLCDLCVSLRSLRYRNRKKYLTQRPRRYAEIAEKKFAMTELRLMSVAIRFRRDARQLMKQRSEMTLILEANAQTDLNQRQFILGQ